MNSDNRPIKIKALLDQSTADIHPTTLEKLIKARNKALSNQRTYTSPVLTWVHNHKGFANFTPLQRPVNQLFAGILLIACLIAGYTALDSYIDEHDISEVDFAILTDDMPVHVYVD